MVVITRPDGKTHTSRNLRGICEYARKEGVSRVVLDMVRTTGQAYINVQFGDGATTEAKFADWRVMRQWVQARRSWRGCEIIDLLG